MKSVHFAAIALSVSFTAAGCAHPATSPSALSPQPKLAYAIDASGAPEARQQRQQETSEGADDLIVAQQRRAWLRAFRAQMPESRLPAIPEAAKFEHEQHQR